MSAAGRAPASGAPPEAPFDAWFLPAGAAAAPTVVEGPLRLTPLAGAEVGALAGALRAARTALLSRSAAERARRIGRAGARFLDPRDPLRREAEARLPATAGVSPAMARAVIEGMARDWTAERLLGLLAAELPHPDALDRFVEGPPGASVRAWGPALSLHVGAGTVPGVSATSLVRALLVGSAVLLKPGRGDVVLSVLLARALAEEASDLAGAAAVVYWEGGRGGAAEAAALAAADLVVAYGGDATVRALRERLAPGVPLIAYAHRLSVALVGRGSLSAEALEATAGEAARAVAMFDQRGCVSPHAVFVEEGGAVSPGEFARALAGALGRLHDELPPGPLAPAEASGVHQLRRTAELRAAAGEGVEVHAGPQASWTVVLDPAPELEPSCLGRTVRVHPVADARVLAERLAPLGRHLQTVGVSGLGDRLETIGAALGAVGVTRICPLAAVPFPPAWWHHDGQGPLAALLRWVDLET